MLRCGVCYAFVDFTVTFTFYWFPLPCVVVCLRYYDFTFVCSPYIRSRSLLDVTYVLRCSTLFRCYVACCSRSFGYWLITHTHLLRLFGWLPLPQLLRCVAFTALDCSYGCGSWFRLRCCVVVTFYRTLVTRSRWLRWLRAHSTPTVGWLRRTFSLRSTFTVYDWFWFAYLLRTFVVTACVSVYVAFVYTVCLILRLRLRLLPRYVYVCDCRFCPFTFTLRFDLPTAHVAVTHRFVVATVYHVGLHVTFVPAYVAVYLRYLPYTVALFTRSHVWLRTFAVLRSLRFVPVRYLRLFVAVCCSPRLRWFVTDYVYVALPRSPFTFCRWFGLVAVWVYTRLFTRLVAFTYTFTHVYVWFVTVAVGLDSTFWLLRYVTFAFAVHTLRGTFHTARYYAFTLICLTFDYAILVVTVLFYVPGYPVAFVTDFRLRMRLHDAVCHVCCRLPFVWFYRLHLAFTFTARCVYRTRLRLRSVTFPVAVGFVAVRSTTTRYVTFGFTHVCVWLRFGYVWLLPVYVPFARFTLRFGCRYAFTFTGCCPSCSRSRLVTTRCTTVYVCLHVVACYHYTFPTRLPHPRGYVWLPLHRLVVPFTHARLHVTVYRLRVVYRLIWFTRSSFTVRSGVALITVALICSTFPVYIYRLRIPAITFDYVPVLLIYVYAGYTLPLLRYRTDFPVYVYVCVYFTFVAVTLNLYLPFTVHTHVWLQFTFAFAVLRGLRYRTFCWLPAVTFTFALFTLHAPRCRCSFDSYRLRSLRSFVAFTVAFPFTLRCLICSQLHVCVAFWFVPPRCIPRSILIYIYVWFVVPVAFAVVCFTFAVTTFTFTDFTGLRTVRVYRWLLLITFVTTHVWLRTTLQLIPVAFVTFSWLRSSTFYVSGWITLVTVDLLRLDTRLVTFVGWFTTFTVPLLHTFCTFVCVWFCRLRLRWCVYTTVAFTLRLHALPRLFHVCRCLHRLTTTAVPRLPQFSYCVVACVYVWITVVTFPGYTPHTFCGCYVRLFTVVTFTLPHTRLIGLFVYFTFTFATLRDFRCVLVVTFATLPRLGYSHAFYAVRSVAWFTFRFPGYLGLRLPVLHVYVAVVPVTGLITVTVLRLLFTLPLTHVTFVIPAAVTRLRLRAYLIARFYRCHYTVLPPVYHVCSVTFTLRLPFTRFTYISDVYVLPRHALPVWIYGLFYPTFTHALPFTLVCCPFATRLPRLHVWFTRCVLIDSVVTFTFGLSTRLFTGYVCVCVVAFALRYVDYVYTFYRSVIVYRFRYRVCVVRLFYVRFRFTRFTFVVWSYAGYRSLITVYYALPGYVTFVWHYPAARCCLPHAFHLRYVYVCRLRSPFTVALRGCGCVPVRSRSHYVVCVYLRLRTDLFRYHHTHIRLRLIPTHGFGSVHVSFRTFVAFTTVYAVTAFAGCRYVRFAFAVYLWFVLLRLHAPLIQLPALRSAAFTRLLPVTLLPFLIHSVLVTFRMPLLRLRLRSFTRFDSARFRTFAVVPLRSFTVVTHVYIALQFAFTLRLRSTWLRCHPVTLPVPPHAFRVHRWPAFTFCHTRLDFVSCLRYVTFTLLVACDAHHVLPTSHTLVAHLFPVARAFTRLRAVPARLFILICGCRLVTHWLPCCTFPFTHTFTGSLRFADFVRAF